jgi:hypothetical protein
MAKNLRSSLSILANQQAANALLTATFAFLIRNNIPKKAIMECARKQLGSHRMGERVSQYRRLVGAYEDMGMILSTWFSLPRFLDRESHPLPMTASRGPHSIASLVRCSRVKISPAVAVELLRRSPSIRIDACGNFVAVKRVFVLPNFEVPRAALVIERYLTTLRRNFSANGNGAIPLLERNCHVPEIDLKTIVPILRDIKERGTAFMDSVDGDIEAHRNRRSKKRGVGELGVLVFAWTGPSKIKRKIK